MHCVWLKSTSIVEKHSYIGAAAWDGIEKPSQDLVVDIFMFLANT